MKTLVIHPKDSTTNFLSKIYEGNDWTVINDDISKKELKTLIKNHSRIVLLGHGTEYGLIGFNRIIIDSKLVYLLREKIGVYIWCNADKFVLKYNLNGFYTGMFISEQNEADFLNVKTNYQWINESNKEFANSIKLSIDTKEMLTNVNKHYKGYNDLTSYNKERFYIKNYKI